MPECAAFDVVRVVRDAEEFSAALDAAVADGRDAVHVAKLRALAEANTWRARAAEVLQALSSQSGGLDVARTAPAAKTPAPPEAATAPGPAASAVPNPAVTPVSGPPLPPVVPGSGQDVIMKRYAHLATPRNRRFFQALAGHMAHAVDHPCLSMYLEFALSTNERGRKVADLIETMTPLAGKRTLDVGCAYGGFLVAMAERGASPTGFDIDPYWLGLGAHNFADVGRSFPTHLADVTRVGGRRPVRRGVRRRHLQRRHRARARACRRRPPHRGDAGSRRARLLRDPEPRRGQLCRSATGTTSSSASRSSTTTPRAATSRCSRRTRRTAWSTTCGCPSTVRCSRRPGWPSRSCPTRTRWTSAPCSLQLRELRKTLDASLASVPEASRSAVGEAVARYLDEAEAAPRERDADRRAFLRRYGVGFWRVVARKAPA